jgi:parallel beta-helix repeat protein
MTAGGSAEASPQPPNAAPAAPAEGRKPPARPKPKLNAPDRRDPKMPDSMDAPPPVKPRVGPALPVLLVDRDNVKIESSCIVKIPADTIIVDADGDGVIQVVKPDVIVEFEQGSVLRGAMAQADPEMRRGFGVRVQGVSGVSLRNVQAEGYLAGIFATRADGLVVESSSFRELRRDVLKSTPQAEDTRDWLSPHRNDMNEWLTNYGAAVYIEDSQGVTVRNVTVRNNQNGIVLDRVTKSKVYDNDCSFLTGWGVALWRSSDNVVARNSLDFCVRGYSHQMYNRGQDSAGLLMFEQCSRNIIAENSATHCGDGLFVFAGNEALGENAKPGEAFDTTGKGCNENLIIGNDFSYSAAHGLEITFSFNNRIVSNRLVGNAICGLWGGYSQNTLILANTITHNGIEGAKEGGGINIEHGHANTIAQNIMGNNSVAISLWWDDDAKLLQSPWAKANHKGSSDNRVLVNSFANEPVPLRLRATTGTRVGANTYEESPEAVDRDDGSNVISLEPGEAPPEFDVLVAKDLPGERVAVGGRRALEGRENIILTRDGPWDHMRTLVRLFKSTPDTDEYEVYRLADRAVVNIVGISDETNAELVPEANLDYPLAGERFRRLTVTAPRPGIYPYRLTFDGRGFKATIPGVLNALKWDTTFFVLDDTFAKAVGPDERRASFDALAAAANSKLKSSEKPFIAGSCAQAELRTLDLPFGVGGPSELKLDPVVTEAALPKDNFGMVATTKLTLPPGSYRATFAFDDGLELTIVVGEGAGAKTMTFGGEWGRSDPVNNVADFDVPGEAKQAVPVTMNVKYYDVHGPGELRLRFLPNWP